MQLRTLLQKFALPVIALLFAFTAGAVFTPQAAQAQDWYVNTDTGDDGNGGGSASDAFATIGEAEDQASAGDVVSIAAGEYNEGAAVLNISKDITFEVTSYDGSSVLDVPNGININSGNTLSLNGNPTVKSPITIGASDATLDVSDGGATLTEARAAASSGNELDNSAGGTIEVGAQTLTIAPASNEFEITGDISSSSGDGKVTVNGGSGTTVQLTANVAVPHLDVTGGTLDPNGNTVDINGDLVRSGGGDINESGTVTFTGDSDQSISPGTGLTLATLNISQSSAASFTFNESVAVSTQLVIGSNSSVDLQSYNIQVNDPTSATTINGSYSGTGEVVINQTSGNSALTLAGTAGNLTLEGTGTVNRGGTGNLSGTLTVDNTTLGNTGGSLTLTDDNVTTPSVVIIDNGSAGNVAGTISVETGVTYDLTYQGDTAYGAGTEWVTGSINNLSVESSATITGNGATTVSGTLTVESGATLSPGGTLTLDGGSLTHSVVGTISGNALAVEADQVTINGSSDTDNAATIQAFTIGDGSGTANVTASDLQQITGALTINDAGALTLTMADEQTVGGALTLGASDSDAQFGALTLGSPIEVTSGGITLRDRSQLDNGGNDLTLSGGAYSATTNISYSGSGTYIHDSAGNIGTGGNVAIPRIQVSTGATLASNVEVSTLLDLDAALADGGNTLTLSGDAEIAANVTGSGTVTVTGSTLTLEGNHSVPNLTINTSGTTTLAGDGDGPYEFSVGTTLTHTQGALALGDQDLVLNAAGGASTASPYSYTDGTISAASGELILDDSDSDADNDDFDLSSNALTIPSVTVRGSDNGFVLKNTTSDGLTVTTLKLTNADLDVSGATLVLAEEGLIDRAAGTLTGTPTFPDVLDVTYSGGALATSNELPGDSVRVLTIEASGEIDLGADLRVSDTLKVVSNTLDIGQGGAQTLTLSDGAWVQLAGGNLNDAGDDGTLSYEGAVTLEYAASAGQTVNSSTNENEWPSSKTDVNLVINNSAGSGTEVTLPNRDDEVMDVSFWDGNLLIDETNTLTVTGDINQTSGGGFVGAADDDNGAVTLSLSGSNAQTITLAEDVQTQGDNDGSSPDPVDVTFDNSAGFTISGAALELVNGDASLTNGTVSTTSGGMLHLRHGGTNDQGFSRTNGYVEGDVRKDILATSSSTAETVTFPTGTDASSYRPVTFTFRNPTDVPSTTMTVGHTAANPQGSNNLPLLTQDEDGNDLRIARYPDFYWTIQTGVDLASDIEYDLKLDAAGFSEFTDEDIANVRILNRGDGVTTNKWRLSGSGASAYDNTQPASDRPIAKVESATGAINSDPGTIFTLGLESNLAAEAIAAKTVNVNDTTAAIDIGANADDTTGVFSGGTGDYSFSVSSSDDNVATGFVSQDSLLSIVGEAGGMATVTVKLTDALNDTVSASVAVTVNDELVAATVANDTIKTDDTLSVDLNNAFTGGTSPITYSVVDSDSSVAIATVEDDTMLTVVPQASGNTDIEFMATDSTGATASNSFNLEVEGLVAPTFTTVPYDTLLIGEGETGKIQYEAQAEESGASIDSFRVGSGAPGFVSVTDAQTGMIELTPKSGDFGSYTFDVIVVDTKGTEADTALTVQVQKTATDAPGEQDLPKKFALQGNYPNPFNPSTNIAFDLPAQADVSITIYDMLGREVMTIPNKTMQPGAGKTVQIDASRLSSGAYIYQVVAKIGDETKMDSGRMTLLK